MTDKLQDPLGPHTAIRIQEKHSGRTIASHHYFAKILEVQQNEEGVTIVIENLPTAWWSPEPKDSSGAI